MRLQAILAAALAALSSPAAAGAHDSATLPLGDGRISAEPRRGFVMACSSRFPGGGGAQRVGEWIKGDRWDPSAKPRVDGDVRWPRAAITFTREGDRRVIRANGLPSHTTGTFPIDPATPAYAYDRNPNRILEAPVLLSLPAQPLPAERPSCVPMGLVGFALSGAAIFNAFDLAGRDAPAYEIQDRCNGHPERTGQYHYHDWSPCLAGSDPDAPVGFMIDGFPILGPQDGAGHVFTNADLDECHGRVGEVNLDGQRVTTYHYRFTREYPYTVGCLRGMQ